MTASWTARKRRSTMPPAELADADVKAERLREARAKLRGERAPRVSGEEKQKQVLKALTGSADGMTATELSKATGIKSLYGTIRDMEKEKKLAKKDKHYSLPS
jgi:hypothetical protein